jgi:outer membrane protein assembly factor BamB
VSVATAQPLAFGADGAAEVQLSAPRVDVIAGAAATRLEQARALVAEKNWDDAVDILRELAAERSDGVVELGVGRYVSLRTACHFELAGLPAEGLAAYRRRVDPAAERWYRDGVSGHDETLLRAVVEEHFCSSWGDDALLALGELALERGDYATARRSWEQISPQLRGPAGQPMWLALRDIDLAAHWPQIERRWHQRPTPATWLAYPDTQLELADVRARLILTSIRAGQLKRAALELEAFRRFHPDSSGRLGGHEGSFAAALDRLIESAREWPAPSPASDWVTFGGSPKRLPQVATLGPATGSVWRKPITLATGSVPRVARDLVVRMPRAFAPQGAEQIADVEEPIRESERPLSFFPVVVDGVIYVSEANQIRAVDLDSGQPALTDSGILHRNEPPGEESTNDAGLLGAGGWQASYAMHGAPRHTLSVVDGVLYGRVGRLATWRFAAGDSEAGDRLVGLDLSRDGALQFRVRPPDGGWAFDGVPVGDGRRLFVAMRKSDVIPHAYVACFDAATGTQLWRTSIGAGNTVATGLGDEITHNLLTLVGDRIYFNSNLGLFAALDVNSGDLVWLYRYDRTLDGPLIRGAPGPLHLDRDPAPCVFHEGLVVAAPSDTPKIIALDADTGQLVWTCDKLPDALHVLGVVRNNLIVSGIRLAAVDVRSGELRFVWPESEHAGIRGMGRGVVAGDEIFWPTRKEIYVIHGVTGAQSRAPVPLGAISDCGANLAAAAGRLVVAGPDKLMVFGAALPVPPTQNEPKTEPVARAK